jgi:indolepyruvate decarboxylase
MDHPLYMGVHVGPISPPPIVARMDQADFVLNLGCLKTDMNFGNRPPKLIQEKTVWAVDRKVDVKYHTYTDVGVRDFVRALLKQDLRNRKETVAYANNLTNGDNGNGAHSPVKVAELLRAVNDFVAENRRYMVVAESGDMMFGGLDLRVTHQGTYLAQGFYASMGFAVPAALGAQLGRLGRPLVLCGDGAFQMTGWELGNCRRYGLDPIVVLFINCSWEMLRVFQPESRFNNLADWRFAELAAPLGGDGVRVATRRQLAAALAKAQATRGRFQLIEVMLQHGQTSNTLARFVAGFKAARANS